MTISTLLAAALLAAASVADAAGSCSSSCDLALAWYTFTQGENLTGVASYFNIPDYHTVLPYNPKISSPDSILSGDRASIPFFSCSCVSTTGGDILAGKFLYTVSKADTYDSIATQTYANLTTSADLQSVNSFPTTNIPNGALINVTVRCFCGDASVSRLYGLFLTYPLSVGDTVDTVAAKFSVTADLLRSFNPTVNFNSGNAIVFVPVKDSSGSYRPLYSSISGGAIAGIVIGIIIALILVGVIVYVYIYKPRREKKNQLLSVARTESSIPLASGSFDGRTATPRSNRITTVPAVTVDKSVEFSYEELSIATGNFSLTNKIGQGGFGTVYYAELRGEKAAIKKMAMQASDSFLAELKVLTRVHHLNLVRLIGYCIETNLFLVYEFIENGNLSQHLRGSGYDPLTWAARVQIALDSARGLEYIHEHTVPVYIHRDIKSSNILIDNNFRAKVADFGLAKLTEVGSTLVQSNAVGTIGYMPPEYARYGEVSPKADVYAFGVVLYELISAKEAIIRRNETGAEPKGLVSLFEDAFASSDPPEAIRKLVDPRLFDDYPIDSVLKMAQLGKACTHEDDKSRPTMRSIVVALMTLSSTTDFFDMNALVENQGMLGLMAGR